MVMWECWWVGYGVQVMGLLLGGVLVVGILMAGLLIVSGGGVGVKIIPTYAFS